MDKIGKYVICEELGRGGMGIIYKALDPDINRDVAIKTIRNDLITEGPQKDKALKQFMIEAQAAGRLVHPHIATIFEVGRQDDLTYIVMQFVPGKSLRKLLEGGRRLSVDDALKILIPVCQALDYAHRNGIVHRDIKPDNILLDTEGRPYLVDFGIATIESVHVTRTRSNTSATPAYMSPEQIMEAPVDSRTDIFSLGIIVFELLTGKRPFVGANLPSLLNKIVTEDPASLSSELPGAPEGLEAAIRKALAKKPQDRFASCAEFATAMEEAVHPEVQTALLKDIRKTQPILPLKTKGARFSLGGLLRQKMRAALLVVLAACAVFIGFLIWKQFLAPAPEYEAMISIAPFVYRTQDLPKNLLEYLLDRSLNASTQVPVFIRPDERFFEKRTDSKNAKARRPMIEIIGTVNPTLTGFEIDLALERKGKTKKAVFSCKGSLDLITAKINDILAFLVAQSGGDIGKIEDGRTFSQICTGNWDAMTHFLKGQEAWDKLNVETARSEFQTTLENDPDFSLALLKQAEVQLFRGDREDARRLCDAALKTKGRLIDYDELRLKALLARLEAKPTEERSFLMQLIEAFPLKKEYLYEFAESYFHGGDGEAAIPYYIRALELDSSYALAHNHIAFCYAWTGDHAKAEDHFQKYVSLDNTANSFDSIATGYMFAGRYDKALQSLEKGISLDPKLDYLYGNLATNFWLTGALAAAEDALDKQTGATTLEATKIDARFVRAFITWLRNDPAKAEAALGPVRTYYAAAEFSDQLDESPALPFWLTGVLAAERKDASRLKAMISVLDKRVAAHNVNATNYFPVLKFLIHLKILEDRLKNDPTLVLQHVQEGERIKGKMGYWGSPFNMAFFLDLYASAIMDGDKSSNKPKELLQQVIAYNPSYAAAHMKLAKILDLENKREEAAKEVQTSSNILAKADKDYGLLKDLTRIEKQISAK